MRLPCASDLWPGRNTHAVMHGLPALPAVTDGKLVRILHRNKRIIEEVDYALRGTFPSAFRYRVGERQWAMEQLANEHPRVVSEPDAARQSVHVVLRRS